MKKNILFVIHCSLFPINSGGRQAIFNGIFAIKEYYNIFITYPQAEDTYSLQEAASFEALFDGRATIIPFFEKSSSDTKHSLKMRVARKIHYWANKIYKPTPKPSNPFSYWAEELLPRPKAYIEHINNIVTKYNIDIVQCEMLRNLSLVHSLPPIVKKVFVHHELGFVRHNLELDNIENSFFDGRAIAESSKVLEIGQLNKYDLIITLSPIDKQKLHEAGVTTRIKESFAIVKPSANFIIETKYYNRLTFIGPDNHGPNYIGLCWFLENCWNQILAQDPTYSLTIIGKWSKQNIFDLSSKYQNIFFAGYVESLELALRNTIMLVPITVGSGIRMKILEASNIGVPFISTSVGAEGIPVENGVHCLIADSSDAFIQAIFQMKDEKLRQQCIKKAHNLVETKYSMSALTQNRLDIYKSL